MTGRIFVLTEIDGAPPDLTSDEIYESNAYMYDRVDASENAADDISDLKRSKIFEFGDGDIIIVDGPAAEKIFKDKFDDFQKIIEGFSFEDFCKSDGKFFDLTALLNGFYDEYHFIIPGCGAESFPLSNAVRHLKKGRYRVSDSFGYHW